MVVSSWLLGTVLVVLFKGNRVVLRDCDREVRKGWKYG